MITIYSKELCPNCNEAIKLAVESGREHQVLKLGVDYTKEELLEKCPMPVRSIPQIFIDDAYIGGLTDLRAQLGLLRTDKA